MSLPRFVLFMLFVACSDAHRADAPGRAASTSAALLSSPVVLTTSADFAFGGNLEGGVDIQAGALVRGASSGGVGTWAATTSFATQRYSHASAAYNGFLYILGGANAGGFLNDVQFAPIAADGTVGAWAQTSAFTTARTDSVAIAWNGWMYLIAGDAASGYVGDVQMAKIHADGTLGAWAQTTALPSAREGHAAVAWNGFMYVLGGGGAPGVLDEVLMAPIHVDGTLGAWTATTSFPTPRFYHGAVALDGRLYVIGGNGASASLLSDVRVATINADGTVGAWSTTSSLLTARQLHTYVGYHGGIFVLGGIGSSGYLGDIEFAPVLANGNLGAWTIAGSYPTPRSGHTSVAVNGQLYVIGGKSGTWLDDVQVAPILGNGTQPRPTGFYSRLIDLEGEVGLGSLTLGGDSARVAYRTASSSGAFGAWVDAGVVAAGTPVALNAPGTRYLDVRLQLAGASNQVTDLTVSWQLQAGNACSAGNGCASGNCVDGVCCSSACGGGSTTDCQACSVAAGAAVDGTCAPISSAHECRASAGPCDVAESCDGTNVACPADGFAGTAIVCRAAAGLCDVAESCSGGSAACPADAVLPASTVCRLSAGACDVAESCTGSSIDCPADAVAPTTTVCRAAAGLCDVAESCAGGVGCPADGFKSASTVCRVASGVCDLADLCTGTAANCPGDSIVVDGTACDAGVCGAGVCVAFDAGVDAGFDAGSPVVDAGTDAGLAVDAGVDAGTSVDAGVDAGQIADAGPAADAGPSVDAGRIADGGRSDAGAGDGGDPGVPPGITGGCGCQTGGSPGVLALSLLGWVVSRRSRTRHSLNLVNATKRSAGRGAD